MPRRDTPFLPNNYYHLYNRGNNRQRIFFEQANYLYFLHGLKEYICPIATITAYCLLPTHYHVMAKVKETQTLEDIQKTSKVFQEDSTVMDASKKTSEVLSPLSHAMKNFLISYTKGINKRYSRVGTLFQGTFKGKPVGTYDYLLNLCIYIHANPVKDGLVEEIADWPYSNYLEWIGERNGSLVDRQFVQDNFNSPAEYKGLVFEYLKTRDLPDDIKRYLQSLET